MEIRLKKEGCEMYSEFMEKRYAPGKRKNSFYMDMPRLEGYEKRMEDLDDALEYTYYIDDSNRKLVQETIQ